MNKEISNPVHAVPEVRVPEADLHVRGFSCIKDLTVKFKRLTVFIGEQAAGKSVTCKFYYFFTQGLRKQLFACVRKGDDFDDFKRQYAKEFRVIFPVTAWTNDTFSIEWSLYPYHFVISHKKGNKKLTFDLGSLKSLYQSLIKEVKEQQKIGKQNSKIEEEEIDSHYRFNRLVDRMVEQRISVPFVDYVPAGRSFFSTIQDTVFTLLSNDIGIDYFLREFGQKFESVRFRYMHGFNRFSLADELRQKILRGNYEYDGKEQWIVRDKDHRVRLADASSGQQESLPLLLLLSNLYSRRYAGPGSVLIEEPEAHLYPTAQRAIVQYLGELLRKSMGYLGCIITTHSPFILCCLNNILGKNGLAPSEVSAYHLYDGLAENIFNKEVGLIDAVRFDDVSTQIANEQS